MKVREEGLRQPIDDVVLAVDGRQHGGHELEVEHPPLDRDVDEGRDRDLLVDARDDLLATAVHGLAPVTYRQPLVVAHACLRMPDQHGRARGRISGQG
jgi:hypothetical protein